MTGLMVAAAPGAVAADPAVQPIRYECTGPLGIVKVGVEVDITNLDSSEPTQLFMPQGIAFDISIDFPTSLFSGLFGGIFGGLGGGLPGLGGLGGMLGGFGGFDRGDNVPGEISDLSLLFGDDEIPVADMTDDVTKPTKDPVLDADASTEDFELPLPGVYDLALPDTFSFSPLSFLGISLFSINCELVSKDAVVDEVEVEEQDSEVEPVVVPDTEETDAPVVVTEVTRQLGGKASGKVVATVGKRVVGKGTLRKGVAVMKLKQLKAGRNVVKVSYLGNRTTKASSSKVRVGRR
ncbi:MAG: hypothetical protein WB767_14785 [Nocardioides sp.]